MKFPNFSAKTWIPALVIGALGAFLASATRAETPPGRYTIAGGVVTDNATGLKWQQLDDGKLYTFADAQAHCSSLGGGSRVPSMKELQTLIDDERANPAIDSSIFTTVNGTDRLGSCYQTSSPVAGTILNWIVCFDEGRPTYDSKTDAYHVLCVQ